MESHGHVLKALHELRKNHINLTRGSVDKERNLHYLGIWADAF